jgi:O-antigen/teichoic acid export membrane protein
MYGIFSSALATTIVLSQLSGFGLQTFWVNIFGREGWRGQRWIQGSLHLFVAAIGLTAMIQIFAAFLSDHNSNLKISLLLLTPAIGGFAAVELTASKLQLEEKYRTLAAWQAAHHAIRLVLVIALVSIATSIDPIYRIGLAYAFTGLCITILAVRSTSLMQSANMTLVGHGERPSNSTEQTQGMSSVAANSWPFCLDALLYLAYFHCSNILLLHLSGGEPAGQYFAAFNIMNAVYILPTVFYTKYLLSKINRWAASDRQKLLATLRQGIVVMLGIGTLMAATISMLSSQITTKIYGPDFSETAEVLMILALCSPLRFTSTAIGSILTTGDNMTLRVKIKSLTLIACITFNLVLIPAYGGIGAAWATVMTEGTLLALFAAATALRYKNIFWQSK